MAIYADYARVYFPDGVSMVVQLFEPPVQGKELVADLPKRGWTVDKFHHYGGQLEGKTYQWTVWVKRAE